MIELIKTSLSLIPLSFQGEGEMLKEGLPLLLDTPSLREGGQGDGLLRILD